MNRDTFRIVRDDGSSRSGRGPKPGARRAIGAGSGRSCWSWRAAGCCRDLHGHQHRRQRPWLAALWARRGEWSRERRHDRLRCHGLRYTADDHPGGSELELSEPVGMETIKGPAAGVTISGGGKSGVFQVESGVTATLSGLTITGGRVAAGEYGGGVFISSMANLSLTDCTISGNSARIRRRPLQYRHDDADRLHHQRQLGRIRRRPVQLGHGQP